VNQIFDFLKKFGVGFFDFLAVIIILIAFAVLAVIYYILICIIFIVKCFAPSILLILYILGRSLVLSIAYNIVRVEYELINWPNIQFLTWLLSISFFVLIFSIPISKELVKKPKKFEDYLIKLNNILVIQPGSALMLIWLISIIF